MATFWEIAARSVSNLFSLYFVYLQYLFISRFGFKSGICLLIAPVPVHCFSITFFETELKWIKLLQSASPLGFNDNIYQEGNISKMPDFDVFSLLDIRKRKRRSHGKMQKGNDKR